MNDKQICNRIINTIIDNCGQQHTYSIEVTDSMVYLQDMNNKRITCWQLNSGMDFIDVGKYIYQHLGYVCKNTHSFELNTNECSSIIIMNYKH